MFLVLTDTHQTIQSEILSQVSVNLTNTEIERVLLAAQIEMEGYLKSRYDTSAIFNATGNNRDPFLINVACDIAIYHLFSRVAPRKIPEMRIIRYDNAISWLKAVSKGYINPALPLLNNTNTLFYFTSNTKDTMSY